MPLQLPSNSAQLKGDGAEDPADDDVVHSIPE